VQNADQTVLVTGATGRQGGAVLRHMLTKGWKLRALTRHCDSYAAQKLADRGVELVQGDLEDPATLERVTRGAYGISVFKISGQSERDVRCNKAKTLLRPQRKLESSILFTVQSVESIGIPGLITGRANGKLKSIFGDLGYRRQCSGLPLSWRTTISTKLRSES